MISDIQSQTYALLYCEYDPKSGYRSWKKLLQNNQIERIDLEIAKEAAKAGESSQEIQQIIYFGSPQSQVFKEVDERLDYSFKITALALLPSLIKHQQRDILMFALSFLKTHLNDEILSQILETSSEPSNSKQIISLLNQMIELIDG